MTVAVEDVTVSNTCSRASLSIREVGESGLGRVGIVNFNKLVL
jgi:hypothetical protein